jgi:hypothetical protein
MFLTPDQQRFVKDWKNNPFSKYILVSGRGSLSYDEEKMKQDGVYDEYIKLRKGSDDNGK